MTKTDLTPKEHIMNAAISLFNVKGYDGTSVRDIANKAKINPANISYYFDSKQGLLEACLVNFFETYLTFLEEEVKSLTYDQPVHCLKRAVYKILNYQSRNHLLTRFVWREVSIDTQIAREIISSYLMKERYLFKRLLDESMDKNIYSPTGVSFLIIQLRSMITMPFLNSQYLREVWSIFPQERFFVEKYYKCIDKWIDDNMLTQKSMMKIALKTAPI